jgi:DNA replication protein DnaC
MQRTNNITQFSLIGNNSQRTNQLTRAFEPLPGPDGDGPEELQWSCPKCGPILPLMIPTGRWIRRSCACERLVKHQAREAEELKQWEIVAAARTFEGWLGAGWKDKKIVDTLSRKTFDIFDPSFFPDAYEAALQFAHNPKGNMVLYGSFGTGKTHLGVAVLNYARSQRITSKFASAPQLMDAVEQAAKSFDQFQHISLLQQLVETPILMIDDVDKVKSTETRQNFWFLIFDQRSKAKRATIISTNKYDQLETYIGEAALSRLQNRLTRIEMIGLDYREDEE